MFLVGKVVALTREVTPTIHDVQYTFPKDPPDVIHVYTTNYVVA